MLKPGKYWYNDPGSEHGTDGIQIEWDGSRWRHTVMNPNRYGYMIPSRWNPWNPDIVIGDAPYTWRRATLDDPFVDTDF